MKISYNIKNHDLHKTDTLIIMKSCPFQVHLAKANMYTTANILKETGSLEIQTYDG